MLLLLYFHYFTFIDREIFISLFLALFVGTRIPIHTIGFVNVLSTEMSVRCSRCGDATTARCACRPVHSRTTHHELTSSRQLPRARSGNAHGCALEALERMLPLQILQAELVSDKKALPDRHSQKSMPLYNSCKVTIESTFESVYPERSSILRFTSLGV